MAFRFLLWAGRRGNWRGRGRSWKRRARSVRRVDGRTHFKNDPSRTFDNSVNQAGTTERINPRRHLQAKFEEIRVSRAHVQNLRHQNETWNSSADVHRSISHIAWKTHSRSNPSFSDVLLQLLLSWVVLITRKVTFNRSEANNLLPFRLATTNDKLLDLWSQAGMYS